MHHACSYVRASARVCACVHARMCVCVRANAHVHTFERAIVCALACMHVCLFLTVCTHVRTSVRACLGVLACVKQTCFKTAISGRPVLHLFNFLNWYVHAFLIEPRPDCTFYILTK